MFYGEDLEFQYQDRYLPIIPLDPKTINLSPLKDFKYVNFIRNARDLEKVIIKLSSKNNFSPSQRCIFNLSLDLNSWCSLLNENDTFC